MGGLDIPGTIDNYRMKCRPEAGVARLGAADYLVKPVSAPVVLARVRTHLMLLERSRELAGLLRERTASLESKSHEAEAALDRASAAESRIISVSEETLQKVGRELHDDLGQQLTGIAFMSEVLCQRLRSRAQPEAEDVAKITGLVNEAIAKTRKLAQGLYPVELQETGLPAMLERLSRRTEEIYGINCEFACNGICEIADELASINLYRIAQESLNNAIKHGFATKIIMELSSGGGFTTLEILDNGRGMTASDGAQDGLGMHSMRYRASLLGAAFQALSSPEGGVRISVSLPVR